MFDIGWSELLMVLVVALVVVGPKDLPRLMRTLGRWVGKARAMAEQFRANFDDMARESELQELRTEIEMLRRNNPVAQAREEIGRSIMAPDAAAQAAPPHADEIEGEEAEAPDQSGKAPPGGEVPPA